MKSPFPATESCALDVLTESSVVKTTEPLLLYLEFGEPEKVFEKVCFESDEFS